MYGTLRVGGSNHFLLKGKDERQEPATLEGAVLVDNGRFPYLLDSPEVLGTLDDVGAVRGALVHFDGTDWEQISAVLDELEGCSTEHPVDDRNLYNRVQREVTTASSKRELAWVYIPPVARQAELAELYPLIKSGDWMDRG